MKTFGMKILLATIIWQTPIMFSQDLASISYTLSPESRLWLEGTATVGDYTCVAGHIIGTANLNPAPEGSSKVRVSIVVADLECGNSAMNQDMYDAMKAEEFPLIIYQLVSATLTDSVTADSASVLRTQGNLTIAGVTKLVSMAIAVKEMSETRFRITGSKTLSMHDFDVVPPTALWGLIKADDRLTVRFKLIAELVYKPK